MTQIVKIQNTHEVLTDRGRIIEEIERYYTDLCDSRILPNEEHKKASKWIILNVGSEDIPKISIAEIDTALNASKRNKASGPHHII